MAVAKHIFISKSAPGWKEHCKHTGASLALEQRKEFILPRKADCNWFCSHWGHAGEDRGNSHSMDCQVSSSSQTEIFPYEVSLALHIGTGTQENPLRQTYFSFMIRCWHCSLAGSQKDFNILFFCSFPSPHPACFFETLDSLTLLWPHFRDDEGKDGAFCLIGR